MALLSISVSVSSGTPIITASSPPSASSRPPHVLAYVSPPSLVTFGRKLLEHSRRTGLQVVRMAPEEEKMTRRSPLDFPIEWERPKPGPEARYLSPVQPYENSITTPSPADPPEEDEEEDEEKKEEEEVDPEKDDDPDKPEQ